MQKRVSLKRMASDMRLVVTQALERLDMSERFFVELFRRHGGIALLDENHQWDISRVRASEWVWICNSLHLPLDSVSMGYTPKCHEYRVGEAIQMGICLLPWNARMKELYRSYLKSQRKIREDEFKTTGGELIKKIQERHFMKKANLKKERAFNRQRLRGVHSAVLGLVSQNLQPPSVLQSKVSKMLA